MRACIMLVHTATAHGCEPTNNYEKYIIIIAVVVVIVTVALATDSYPIANRAGGWREVHSAHYSAYVHRADFINPRRRANGRQRARPASHRVPLQQLYVCVCTLYRVFFLRAPPLYTVTPPVQCISRALALFSSSLGPPARPALNI